MVRIRPSTGYKPRKRTPIPFKVRKEIYTLYNGCCAYCGVETTLFKNKRSFTPMSAIDHIHPFSKGGSNDKENLQLLCIYCNAKKFDKIPEGCKCHICQ